jgi:hypothetical protein
MATTSNSRVDVDILTNDTVESRRLARHVTATARPVDLPKIWKNYLANGAKLPNPAGTYIADRSPPTDLPAIFERLTGAPLEADKTAFRLPLRVAVTNAAGESDELRISLIVTAPKADISKLMAEQQAKQAKAREEMLRRQEESRAAAMQETPTPSPGADGDRVSQLENRVRRLEATLDTVLQKLDRLENAQKGDKKQEEKKQRLRLAPMTSPPSNSTQPTAAAIRCRNSLPNRYNPSVRGPQSIRLEGVTTIAPQAPQMPSRRAIRAVAIIPKVSECRVERG